MIKAEKHTVLIAGGSGLIGSSLTRRLLAEGHAVRWLSRSKRAPEGVTAYVWDPEKGLLDAFALEGADTVINLAGTGIADSRWTEQRKALIIRSRTRATELLGKAIAGMDNPPALFIGASAIGFYGNRGEESLTESSSAGTSGFLPASVQEVEAAIHTHIPDAVRVLIPRFGVVLSTKGGALPRMTFPMNFGLAAYLGNGRQYISWIHIEDVCQVLVTAITDDTYTGTINITSPQAVTSYDFAGALRSHWSSLSVRVPVPAFVLRILYGEMADTILDSAIVLPEKLAQKGYSFQFPTLGLALEDLKKNKA